MRRVGVVMLALVLTACAGQGGSAGSGTGEEPAGGTAGGQVLTVWAFEGEETFLPTVKEAFEAEHPGTTLEITEIPEDSYTTKVDTALAAGSPPDIGLVYEPRWIKAGRVLPLDDAIEAAAMDVSTLNQNALSGCLFEGSVYCLGSYVGSVMLFYNKALFDQAGVPYPSPTEPMSYDEYAALAAQLSQPNEDLAQRVWATVAEAPFWWQDPLTHFTEDGRTTTGQVNDQPTVHIYEQAAGLVQQGHAPSASESELMGEVDLLATGQVAMAISDNLVAIESLETAGIDWGAAPVPVEVEGAPTYVSSWTDQFAVFADSPNADAAVEFVVFLGTDGNKLRVDAADQLPLDSAVAEASGWAGESAGRADVAQIVDLARPAIFVPGFWDVTAPLWDSFDLMVEEELTSQEALDESAPLMQDSLDQAWETWEAIQP